MHLSHHHLAPTKGPILRVGLGAVDPESSLPHQPPPEPVTLDLDAVPRQGTPVLDHPQMHHNIRSDATSAVWHAYVTSTRYAASPETTTSRYSPSDG